MNVGIVVNTCNRKRPLKRIVNNIVGQKEGGDRLIVVNDGQEGNLPELPDRTTVIEHNKDYYALASGRNKGWQISKDLGMDYALFFDDDMVLENSCLGEYRKAWRNDYEFCKGKIINRQTGLWDIRFWDDRKALKFKKDEEDQWAKMIEEGRLCYGGSNIALSIDLLDKVGGWDEQFDGNWGWEDRDLTWRLVERGHYVKFLLDAIVTHMALPEVGDYRRRQGDNYQLFCDKHPEFPQRRRAHGQNQV